MGVILNGRKKKISLLQTICLISVACRALATSFQHFSCNLRACSTEVQYLRRYTLHIVEQTIGRSEDR